MRRACPGGICAAGACPGRIYAGGISAAGNHAAGLGGVRALTGGSQLGHDDLVDQRDVSLDLVGGVAEELGGRLNGASGLALAVSDVESNVCHDNQAPFTAVRTRTMPPLGPGMAPLMARTLFSASADMTVRLWTVAVT